MPTHTQQDTSHQIISEENIQTHQKFLSQEIIDTKKKELLTELKENYGGYKEIFGNDFNKIVDNFKKYGIRITDLELFNKARAKINGMRKFYGLGIGPLIGVIPGKDLESTVNHETIHTVQYAENSPISFLSRTMRARLGFFSFGVIKQGILFKKLRDERKKYGIRAAAQYATKNTPMEFEAFLQEGNTKYLETRRPFTYKKYEKKSGRSEAMIQELDDEILKRIQKMETVLTAIEAKQDVSEEDIAAINQAITQIIKEAKQIENIKEKYGEDDWELVGTMEGAKGVIRRAEHKTLVREKRLPLLEKLLGKEHACLTELKKDKNIQIISSQIDMDENGIIKIQAKDGDIENLLKTIEGNQLIQSLMPHTVLETSGHKSYIRIVFVT